MNYLFKDYIICTSMKVEHISFEQIKQYWQKHLWQNRKTEILPVSHMCFLGGTHKYILHQYQPFFLGIFDGIDLIAVNSCHKTTDFSMRSRGIHVNPNYRKQGIAGLLFKETFKIAQQQKCSNVWSIPRQSSLETYLKYGFVVFGDKIEDLEFGPNYWVLKTID